MALLPCEISGPVLGFLVLRCSEGDVIGDVGLVNPVFVILVCMIIVDDRRCHCHWSMAMMITVVWLRHELMTAVPLFWHSQSLSHDGGAIADVSDAPMGKRGCTFTKTHCQIKYAVMSS